MANMDLKKYNKKNKKKRHIKNLFSNIITNKTA